MEPRRRQFLISPESGGQRLPPGRGCSTFVLMIGALALPSDDPPGPARDAGYGDRFRYWRGASGRRYLFSLVPAEALPDFNSVVVMVAERRADGRLIGRGLIDVGEGGCRHAPRLAPGETPFRAFPGAEPRRAAKADRRPGRNAGQARSLEAASAPSWSDSHSSVASWRSSSRRWRTVLITYSLFAPDCPSRPRTCARRAPRSSLPAYCS